MTSPTSAFCSACGSAFTPDARSCSDCGRADARYHAALRRVHGGDVEGVESAGRLHPRPPPRPPARLPILGTAAQWARDDAALAQAYREFHSHYEGEMRAGRPEYAERRASLDEFRRRAERGVLNSPFPVRDSRGLVVFRLGRSIP